MHLPFKSRIQGYSLIESVIALAVIAIGITIIYLGFIQARKTSARNQEISIGLTLLNAQIDTDSQATYATLDNTTPPLMALTGLPNATITRSVTTDATNSIKKITYTLSWSGAAGDNTLHADYELTNAGLNND